MKITELTTLRSMLGGDCSQVEAINLDGDECALAVELPSETNGERFPRLKRLMLVKGGLTALPENLGSFASLEWLVVWKNQLTRLPESVGSLSKLSFFHGSNNLFTEVPLVLAGLPALNDLNIHANPFERLASACYPGVVELDIRNCGLTALSDEIRHFPGLEILKLDANEITSISPAIGTLTDLARLQLHDNQLTDLPTELGELPIVSLQLPRNPLAVLPAVVAQLTQLRTLDISDCGLRSLPDSIGALSKLRYFDLGSNQLDTFPVRLRDLGSLTRLILRRNPGFTAFEGRFDSDDVAEILDLLFPVSPA